MRKEMGNNNRIRQAALSFTLTLCMVAGMITWPGAAIRSEADVTPPEKTISGVGSNGLRNPDIPTGLNVPWSGSIVYYGNKINESLSTEGNDVQIQVLGSCPGKYRVLDPRTTEYGGTTMFLDSDTIIYYQQFNTECNTHTGDPSLQTPKNRWIDSPIRSELNGDRFLNRNGIFTDIERNAIAASTKESFQYPFDGLPYGYHWSYGYWEAYTALTGEKIFLLDMSDLCRMAYGYNIGVNNGGGNPRTSRLKSIYGSELWDNWWLRSPDPTNSYNDNAGIFMEYYGVLNSSPVTSYRGVSPAFNVNLSKVIFTSPISSETDTHKLTLLDSGYDFRIYSPTFGGTVTETDSEYVFSSGFSLSDTDTNEGCYPNWMSYVITTGTWNDSTGWSEGAAVLKYEVFEDLAELPEI